MKILQWNIKSEKNPQINDVENTIAFLHSSSVRVMLL